MNNQTLQELDTSPYTKKDSLSIRKFFKVHQACNQLNEALKVIYDNSLTEAEILEFLDSTNKLENAIAESPATFIASYITDIKPTVDFQNVFDNYSFDGDSSPVHQFIHYPVVSDQNLETLAFIHRSYPNMNVNLTETQKTLMSNERLEFLGDSWLGALVAYIIYEKYPYADEGALSKMKSAIVNNNNLEKLCTRLGFKERLKENIPRFSMKFKDKFSKYYADCVEAYIGALVIDRFSVEFKEIADWLEDLSQEQFNELGSEMLKKPLNKNAKGELAELLQFNKIGAKLSYTRMTTTSPFTIEVILGDKVLAVGTGPNVKEAEQRAAMEVLGNPELIQKYSLFKLETNDAAKYLVEEIPTREGVLPGHKIQDIETPVSISRSPINGIYNSGSQIEANPSPEIMESDVHIERHNEVTERIVEDNTPSHDTSPLLNNNIAQSFNNFRSPSTTGVHKRFHESQEADSVDALAQAIMSKMATALRPMVTDIISELEESKQAKSFNTNLTATAPIHALVDNGETTPSLPKEFKVPPLPPKPVRGNGRVPSTNISNINNIDKRLDNFHFDIPQPNVLKSNISLDNTGSRSDVTYDKNASATLYTTLGSVNLFPCYDVNMLESGGFHSVCSIMGVGTVLAEGTGRSKKIAQHISANNALHGQALQQVMKNAGSL